MDVLARTSRLATLLLVLSLTLGGSIQAQQFRSLGASWVRIETDGTVLVVPRATRPDVGPVPDVGDDVVRVATDPNTILVDSDGIEWVWQRGPIVGMRDGEVVHEHADVSASMQPRAFEGAGGRRWFVCAQAIHAFDGTAWTRHDVRGAGGGIRETRVAVSDDRRHVVLWTGESSVGIAIAEEDDGVSLLDLGKDERWGRLRQVVPLGDGRVATTPGCEFLGPDDRWPLPSKERPRYFSAHHVSTSDPCALDRFVVSSAASFLESHGGPLVLSAFECGASSSVPPEAWEMHLPFESRQWGDRRSSSPGRFVLLRVGPDRHAVRATLVEEAFEPTYVDRSGRLWRHLSSSSLLGRHDRTLTYLEDDLAWTLVDAEEGVPVPVRSFFGVDRRGRAYLWIGPGEAVVFDPTAEPTEEARFAWQSAPVEVWRPEREAEALAVVTEALRMRDVPRAHDVARRFDGFARTRRDRLSDPFLWEELTAALTDSLFTFGGPQLIGEMRAAELVGLEDVVAGVIEAERKELPSLRPNERIRRASALAVVLERRGDLRGAVESHAVVVDTAVAESRLDPDLAVKASRCAVRLRRFDLAVRWAELGIDASGDRGDRGLGDAVEAIERYREDPESLEANLEFLLAYWLRQGLLRGEPNGVTDALTHVLDLDELTGEPYRFVVVRLIDALIASGDLDGARVRLAELADRGGIAREPALRAQLDLADAYLAREDLATARQEYERLLDLGSGTAFAHRARLGLARAHLIAGDPRAAHRAAKPLIPLLYGAARPAHGLDTEDGRSLAIVLVHALEAVGNDEKALEVARDAKTRFPALPVRNHDHSRRRKKAELEILIERLEARVDSSR